jgi:hypothetical protein
MSHRKLHTTHQLTYEPMTIFFSPSVFRLTSKNTKKIIFLNHIFSFMKRDIDDFLLFVLLELPTKQKIIFIFLNHIFIFVFLSFGSFYRNKIIFEIKIFLQHEFLLQKNKIFFSNQSFSMDRIPTIDFKKCMRKKF